MKKAFLLPLVLFGFCCAEANAAFLNDSESFVIARSVKLGDTGISVSPGGGTGTKKLSCTADDPDCKGPIICKKDTQCPAGQYCKLGFCKPLCDEGKTTKGVKCADIPRTPNCTIKDGGLIVRLAMTRISLPVIARSVATWQSINSKSVLAPTRIASAYRRRNDGLKGNA